MTYITDIKQAATILADSNINLITFEQDISYDINLSSYYFSDFINNVSGCHDVQKFDDYLVIYGNDVSRHDKHFKKSELVKMKKANLLELCDMLDLSCWDNDKKSDLIEYLLSVDNEDYYAKYHINTSYHDLDYTFSFSGYSQGDTYKVQTVGDVEPWLNADYLTNVFYDTPINGTIEIYVNGNLANEVHVNEFLKNEYDYYNKDKLISYVAEYAKDLEYKDLLIEWLDNEIPTNLEYN